MASTEAQKKAAKAYRARNKGARFPGVILNEDESLLLDDVSAHFSSKKEAIIEGLKILKQHLRI